MSLLSSTTAQAIGLLILRLGIGGYMLSHGVSKLRLLLTGQFDVLGDPVGIGNAATLILLVLAEFLCALLVMAGLLTRLAGVPLVIAMAVAAFVAHGGDPWSAETGVMLYMSGQAEHWFSKQPALMYLMVFLALIFTGGGSWSLDAWLSRRCKRKEQTNGKL